MSYSYSGRSHVEDPLARADLLAWATVRAGLTQMLYGAVLAALGLIALAASMYFLPNGLGPGRGFDSFGTVMTGAMTYIGFVLMFFGAWVCCGVPGNFGARPWMVLTILCVLIGVSMVILRIILANPAAQAPPPQFGQPAPAPRVVQIEDYVQMATPYVLQATGVLAGVFFLLFLRRTAVVAGNNRQDLHVLIFLVAYLSISATLYVVLLYLEPFGGFVAIFLGPVGQRNNMGPIVLTLSLASMAGYVGWFAALTACVRAALTRRLLDDLLRDGRPRDSRREARMEEHAADILLDDSPGSKPQRDDDEENDPRPRRKSARGDDEEEEDSPPRGRTAREDDEYDPRVRRKRRPTDDDDD